MNLNLDLDLQRGTLVRRYKRFLADIELESGEFITAHCANSGAMTACAEPGRPVFVSDSHNPKRKLRYTWELIQMGRTWVGVNTARPNHIAAHAIEKGAIPELTGYANLKREVKYGREGRSRIDILLSNHSSASDCYVEVKNATMRVGNHAAFPDAVTARGLKHIEELDHVAQNGLRAVMFFFVGRNDCKRFRPAEEVDIAYTKALRRVAGRVELLAYRFRFSPGKVSLAEKLPIDL